MLIHVLTAADVGKRRIRRPDCGCCGQRRPPIDIGSAIGEVQAIDVGKRVYDVDGVIQVENDNQRDARIKAYNR